MKHTNLYYLFYPFLNLKLIEKIKFLLIALFSLVVIFIDVSTISIISLIFFDANNSFNYKANEILRFIYNQLNSNLSFFHFQFVIIAIILFLRNIFFLAQEFFIKTFVFKHYNINSKKLFHLYASTSILKFYKKGIDYYLKNLNRETWYCYIGVLYAILYLIVDIVYFVLIIFFGFYLLNFEFRIDIFLPILLFILLISILFVFLKKIGVERKNYEQKYYTDTLNILRSILEIQIYKKINFFADSFSKYLHKFSKTIIFAGIANLTPKAIIEIIAAIIIVYFLIYNNLSLNLELFTLIAFILFRLGPVISRIIQNISLSIFFAPSNKILINEFKTHREKKIFKHLKIKNKINSISLINANFNFGKTNILKNFNYKFSKNKIYGIYGESGKGKTTLLMILSGTINLDSGRFKINNSAYNTKNRKINWGHKIGFMSQYNVLIDASLKKSIFLDNSVSQVQILAAKEYLKKFKLKKLIKFLNPKYDGVYSLNGMLSGGEKQRISIIRTILLGGEILFFDEPTSSLDKENEKIVLKEFKKLKKDKIIIISSHKKELKSYFDKIINL